MPNGHGNTAVLCLLWHLLILLPHLIQSASCIIQYVFVPGRSAGRRSQWTCRSRPGENPSSGRPPAAPRPSASACRCQRQQRHWLTSLAACMVRQVNADSSNRCSPRPLLAALIYTLITQDLAHASNNPIMRTACRFRGQWPSSGATAAATAGCSKKRRDQARDNVAFCAQQHAARCPLCRCCRTSRHRQQQRPAEASPPHLPGCGAWRLWQRRLEAGGQMRQRQVAIVCSY